MIIKLYGTHTTHMRHARYCLLKCAFTHRVRATERSEEKINEMGRGKIETRDAREKTAFPSCDPTMNGRSVGRSIDGLISNK